MVNGFRGHFRGNGSRSSRKYEEMCRRFLADQKDFSEENLEEAGIVRRYYNDDKVQCLEKIIGEIQNGKF